MKGKERKIAFINKDTLNINMDYLKTYFFDNRNEAKNLINPEGRKKKKNLFNEKRKNQMEKSLIGNRIQFKKYTKFIGLIIIINLFQILSSNKVFLNEMKFSNITIKIRGKGTKKILSTYPEYFNSNYFPNEIYINGNKKTPVGNSYYLDQEDNTIKLVWY